MPKTAKKNTPARKPKKAAPPKRATAKTARTPKKKMKMEAHAGKAQTSSRTGFMWKLLERKEAERKKLQDNRQNNTNPLSSGRGSSLHSRGNSFSKFSGPRRRAA